MKMFMFKLLTVVYFKEILRGTQYLKAFTDAKWPLLRGGLWSPPYRLPFALKAVPTASSWKLRALFEKQFQKQFAKHSLNQRILF